MDTITFLRQFRIGPFSVFDFAAAYIGMYMFAPVLSRIFRFFGIMVSRAQWMWLTVPISVVVHIILGLRTPLVAMLFDPFGHYAAKIIVLGMCYMAIRKRV